MKNSNVGLLTAMTSILLVMLVPAAMGQATPETHAVDIVGPSSDPGTFMHVQSVASQTNALAEGTDFVGKRVFVYHDTDNDFQPPIFPTTFTNIGAVVPCDEVVPEANDRMWVWYDISAGVEAGASHENVGVNGGDSSVFFDSLAVLGNGFGSGTAASVEQTGNMLLLNTDLDGSDVEWREINSAGNVIANSFDDTSQAGRYFVVMCVFLDTNDNKTWDVDNDGLGEDINVQASSKTLFTSVGGMVMGIETMPLLVAGAEMNALWILPILGLAGMIIAIRKLEA